MEQRSESRKQISLHNQKGSDFMSLAKNESSIWFDNGNNTPSPTSPNLNKLASLKVSKQRSNS